MATKNLITIGSILNIHPDYVGNRDCGLCSKGGNHKWGISYDVYTNTVLDWRESDSQAEMLICPTCESKFDPTCLLEV